MLKRIYIDNFKCFVNFELSTDAINLFLGPNGAGKSTLFDVLRRLQAFLGGDGKVDAIFHFNELTRWQTSLTQSFELEIEGNGGIYKYELAIEHEDEGRRTRVSYERLWFDKKPLLSFQMGDVQLYRDNHSEGPSYPFDWSQSAVASIYSRKDNKRLTWFKERMDRFLIIQIIPSLMVDHSDKEEIRLTPRMDNYVSWYRYLSQDQGKILELTKVLQGILDGFAYFRFAEAGEERRILKLYFADPSGTGQNVEYRFGELSDGQRMLIALYTLLCATQGEKRYTLCVDEPENFLALPEIQPWLVKLYDLCSEGKIQALLISHHPEMINYLLASPVGYWLDHHSNTPVRARPITAADSDTGLPISELIARGWLHE
jgi:predicted ATPase